MGEIEGKLEGLLKPEEWLIQETALGAHLLGTVAGMVGEWHMQGPGRQT